MAVRNRIRRGLARFPWRGATGLALTLLVGCLFLWAAQLAWAVGKGRESVEADLPEVFASAAPTEETPDVKRLKSELKSLRAENEQLMQAIQMLAEEIQWLHGEGRAANWPRDDAQGADSDKKKPQSNKIHPEFAAELFALEQELMDEIDAPVIEAELKRRLDEFRGALAESSDGDEAHSKHEKADAPAKLSSAPTSELENFRQEYKNYITERLEYLKGKRKILFQQGTLTIEYATAMDTLILELMGRLLALKEEAASRQKEKNSQSQLDYPTYPTYPTAIPAPLGSAIEKPAPQPTSVATATPASKDSRSGLNAGEFKIKIAPEGKTATVSFYDPALDLIIHVETSLQTLPELLRQLSKRNQSANNSPPIPASKNAVPNDADPPPATFEADPFSEDEIESAPPQPGFGAKPFKPVPSFESRPDTADVS